ncbi:GntR family transcriptional regulator [Mycolicibacter arupensis]|jgi:DNA-binding transcriptional regulator YhcF (GntR family)|uniref:GntR family transcriptional regulator n=1 Tax=Mycolicibacter arupensis TaxID=342002 RepID=A0A0F5MU37_9MYCO|nr:GntR family transcriptional regulator [Mycolicibacter arupensis]KKB98313.1 GntR family transcriptional regulator [Mycolicibacter arupensis]MCV7277287.1 GntR family transcriptional regulator [Mycolicibacter arupensis]OQZ98104.1 GntR family transcriptional regulator [Mycolicibacter arupensis]
MDFAHLLKPDAPSDAPLFEQIRSALIEAVRTGSLPAGTRLPTVRDLAGQLGLAVNTVARAYRELEAGGVVETRGRFGTFVASADPAEATMTQAASAFVAAARSVGLSKPEALRYLDAAFDSPGA